ncbi:unnamed protein product [Pleuronectes platessa]|uniref:Uncharacterized protein n=1 Tax=Pleuronectes platessa TaxID=8262 RepID=A0A9N7UDY6_PLEPL|nr:unnamed protein product [Pleuronectes platessa]
MERHISSRREANMSLSSSEVLCGSGHMTHHRVRGRPGVCGAEEVDFRLRDEPAIRHASFRPEEDSLPLLKEPDPSHDAPAPLFKHIDGGEDWIRTWFSWIQIQNSSSALRNRSHLIFSFTLN